MQPLRMSHPARLQWINSARRLFSRGAQIVRRTRKAADGIGARLPLRWPKRETGKTASFLMPSRPVNTRTSDASNVVVDSRFLATSTITSSDRDQC